MLKPPLNPQPPDLNTPPLGVYQEVMGSVHNMFGSLNTVVVRSDAPSLDERLAGESSGGWWAVGWALGWLAGWV